MFMPTFLAKREVFDWLLSGKKTIDVRKGQPVGGDTAVFMSGTRRLTLRVVGTQVGRLGEVVREDNFRLVIPSAGCLEEALAYFRGLYGVCDGVFTAYFVTP
jgi:ASC-1-like (ASCH) protein